MTIIEQLKHSQNPVLTQEAANIEQFKDFKHNKTDLALFLKCNLTEIAIPKLNLCCTSNPLIVEGLIKLDKTVNPKLIKYFYDITGDVQHKRGILTWDIIRKKVVTIRSSEWTITNFITIKPENQILIFKFLSQFYDR